MFDKVLKGAKIVDGTGNPWFKKDLGIKNGRIERIGKIDESMGRRILDVEGLVVCPGFIDIHSHSDMNILTNPRATNKISQGITTEVTGNCGISPAPVNEENVDQLKNYVSHMSKGLDWSWQSLEITLSSLKEREFQLI